jgi:hypothetical protein
VPWAGLGVALAGGLLLTPALAGCGSAVDAPDTRRSVEVAPTVAATSASAAVTAAPPLSVAVPPRPSQEPPPIATFVDPGCPMVAAPVQVVDCDPLNSCPPGEVCPASCAPDEACVPFVNYPDEPCAPEEFGTHCVVAGTGVQGSPCGEAARCANGFLCVATGHGTRCAELCALPGVDTCPAGLLCGAVDIEGFGVCF